MIVQPKVAPVNVPVNVVIVEEHVVQVAADEEPEIEILTINSDDECVEISCDEDDEVELPPEAQVSSVVSTVPPMISAESLALLIKSVTKKMGNPPSDPPIQSEEQTIEDLKDPDTQQVKRRRRDPRPSVFIEQSKDQPVTADEDEDGLYDFDFEEDTTSTSTATETGFVFEADTTRMDVDSNPTEIPVVATVSSPITESTQLVTAVVASSSGTVRDVPCSTWGKRPEEPLRMSFDLRGKLEKKFGDEISGPANTERMRKAKDDRARAFAKDDADRAAAMEDYFTRVTDKDVDKAKAARLKKKREYVVVKNENLNPADEDVQVTHHLMDVGENYYVKVGNLSGIISWGFDHGHHRWWIKRKVGPVEWYKNPAQFQTFNKVDLIILSKSPYVDDKPGGRGYLFLERL
ncbi:hypothetical protein Hanom_Chr07g00628071 [Helianthus anomalus]